MRYEYKNANPKTDKAGDCVIRAISLALNQSWETTYKDLFEIGLKMKRMPNDRKVWRKYLESKGWVKCSEPRNWDNTKMTIIRAVDYIKESEIIVNAGNLHVTYIKDKVLYDTWNCSNKTMHSYWRKK